MLEALAAAIDGTNGEEAARLAAEFNDSFGNLVRASVEVESVCGERPRTEAETEVPCDPRNSSNAQKITDRSKARERKREVKLDNTVEEVTRGLAGNESDTTPPSSDESDVKKPKKKKKKRNVSKKKHSRDSSSSPNSDHSSDS